MGNLLSKKPSLHHSKPCLRFIVYFCFAVADFTFEAATLSDPISCDNVLQLSRFDSICIVCSIVDNNVSHF